MHFKFRASQPTQAPIYSAKKCIIIVHTYLQHKNHLARFVLFVCTFAFYKKVHTKNILLLLLSLCMRQFLCYFCAFFAHTRPLLYELSLVLTQKNKKVMHLMSVLLLRSYISPKEIVVFIYSQHIRIEILALCFLFIFF